MTIWNVGGRGVRPEPKPHNNQRLYTWRGETFISQSDLAAEAGVTTKTVQMHLRLYGHLDRLGTKGGNRNPAAATAARSKPLTVLGQHFATNREFARKVGRPQATIYRWVHLGQIDKMEEALRRVM